MGMNVRGGRDLVLVPYFLDEIETAFVADTGERGCAGTIGLAVGCLEDIGDAEVAADGSFKMELPDFKDDPFVGDDLTAEILFRLNGVPNVSLLLPQLSQGQTLRVAASYAAEVIFVPLELRDHSRANEVERKMYEWAPSFHEQLVTPVLASEAKK